MASVTVTYYLSYGTKSPNAVAIDLQITVPMQTKKDTRWTLVSIRELRTMTGLREISAMTGIPRTTLWGWFRRDDPRLDVVGVVEGEEIDVDDVDASIDLADSYLREEILDAIPDNADGWATELLMPDMPEDVRSGVQINDDDDVEDVEIFGTLSRPGRKDFRKGKGKL